MSILSNRVRFYGRYSAVPKCWEGVYICSKESINFAVDKLTGVSVIWITFCEVLPSVPSPLVSIEYVVSGHPMTDPINGVLFPYGSFSISRN